MNIMTGNLTAEGKKFGIVVARFNELVTSKLLDGANDCLMRSGVMEGDIDVAWVPGAFEIPLAAQKMAQSKKYDALICLGAVIKGSTSHFDYVCSGVTSGCNSVALESGIPVLFGVLTTDNLEQALERAGSKAGNKGFECAQGAIEMASLVGKLNEL